MDSLKKILKDAGITYFELANSLNIKSLSTINQKMNKKSNFTFNEAKKIKNLIEEKTGKRYSIEELFSENDGTDEKKRME